MCRSLRCSCRYGYSWLPPRHIHQYLHTMENNYNFQVDSTRLSLTQATESIDSKLVTRVTLTGIGAIEIDTDVFAVNVSLVTLVNVCK